MSVLLLNTGYNKPKLKTMNGIGGVTFDLMASHPVFYYFVCNCAGNVVVFCTMDVRSMEYIYILWYSAFRLLKTLVLTFHK